MKLDGLMSPPCFKAHKISICLVFIFMRLTFREMQLLSFTAMTSFHGNFVASKRALEVYGSCSPSREQCPFIAAQTSSNDRENI